MGNLILRGLCFVVGAAFTLFIYWLGGGEFQRGEGMALMAVFSACIGGFLAAFPYLEGK